VLRKRVTKKIVIRESVKEESVKEEIRVLRENVFRKRAL